MCPRLKIIKVLWRVKHHGKGTTIYDGDVGRISGGTESYRVTRYAKILVFGFINIVMVIYKDSKVAKGISEFLVILGVGIGGGSLIGSRIGWRLRIGRWRCCWIRSWSLIKFLLLAFSK